MIKHKIHEIAKDLDMQSKDLMTMLEGKVNMSKKHNTVLEDDMLNFVFEKLTKDNEAADLNEYLEPKKAKAAEAKKEQKPAPKQEAKPAPKKEAKPEPKKEEQPKLKKDTYYFSELIGCKVIDQNSNVIGEVIKIEEYSANQTLRIRLENGKDLLLPFMKAFIKKVDIENKEVHCHLIEGML